MKCPYCKNPRYKKTGVIFEGVGYQGQKFTYEQGKCPKSGCGKTHATPKW